jgi:hypothetical protein
MPSASNPSIEETSASAQSSEGDLMSALLEDLKSNPPSRDELMAKHEVDNFTLDRHVQALVNQGLMTPSECERLTGTSHKESPDLEEKRIPFSGVASAKEISDTSKKAPSELSQARNNPISNESRNKKVNAKAVVQDIRTGMDDIGLMQKYGLSAKQLTALYKKLDEAGLMKKH